MADTIAVMSDGRIEQVGSAAELYERPPRSSSPSSSARRTYRRASPTGREGAVATFEADGGARSARADGRASTRRGRAGAHRRAAREDLPAAGRRGAPAVNGANLLLGHVETPASSASPRSTSSGRTAGRNPGLRPERRSGLEQLGAGARGSPRSGTPTTRSSSAKEPQQCRTTRWNCSSSACSRASRSRAGWCCGAGAAA